MDAGILMPALVSSMPMPSFGVVPGKGDEGGGAGDRGIVSNSSNVGDEAGRGAGGAVTN